jgi:Fe-S-cluster containining protein
MTATLPPKAPAAEADAAGAAAQVMAGMAGVGPQLTRKEAVWLACKQKTCCYAAVIPTGGDVWRISRSLDTPPWSFLVYFHSPQLRRDAFLLDHSGRSFRIALAKGKKSRTAKPAPCVFLLKLRGGHHRCGLGDLRPNVCRSFPSEIVEGVVCIRPDHGCACREWTLADVDIAEELVVLDERQQDAALYCQVVESWNAHVLSTPPDTSLEFTDFCEYVLRAYDQLASEQEAAQGDAHEAAL